MTSSHAQLLRNQDLCDWWNAVVLNDRYSTLEMHVRADLSEGGGLTPEQQEAINRCLAVFKIIATKADPKPPLPSPRIRQPSSEPRNRPFPSRSKTKE